MTGNARELCEYEGIKPHTMVPYHSHSASKGVAERAIGVQFGIQKLPQSSVEIGGKSFTANWGG